MKRVRARVCVCGKEGGRSARDEPNCMGQVEAFNPADRAVQKCKIPRAPQPAEFEFYDPQSPMYTSPRVLPPATMENCTVQDAIIAQVGLVCVCDCVCGCVGGCAPRCVWVGGGEGEPG